MTTPVDLAALRSSFPPGDPDAAEFIAVLDALAVAIEALTEVEKCRHAADGECVTCDAIRSLDRIRALVTPEGETR